MAKRSKIAAADESGSNFNPDDEAECFSAYSEKKSEIARIQQSIAMLFSRYDKLGVDTAAIKHAYTMSQKDDAQAIHRSRTETMVRLRIIEFDGEGQGTFLKGLAVVMPSPAAAKNLAVGRAKAQGYNDGYAGGPIDNCPYSAGTEENVHWREQWNRGYADRIEADPSKADVTQAQPRKRGRPKNTSLDLSGEAMGHA